MIEEKNMFAYLPAIGEKFFAFDPDFDAIFVLQSRIGLSLKERGVAGFPFRSCGTPSSSSGV
jgi:hypothetical protein